MPSFHSGELGMDGTVRPEGLPVLEVDGGGKAGEIPAQLRRLTTHVTGLSSPSAGRFHRTTSRASFLI
jgi:hypothetical protein